MVLTRGWFCLENLNYLGYWRGAEFGETAQVQDYFSLWVSQLYMLNIPGLIPTAHTIIGTGGSVL